MALSNAELACVYAALILVDDEVAITVSRFFKITLIASRKGYCESKQTLFNLVLIFIFSFCIQGEKLATLLKAANVDVEPYWPSLFAKALEGVDVKNLISSIGSGVGAAPAAGAAAPAAAGKFTFE